MNSIETFFSFITKSHLRSKLPCHAKQHTILSRNPFYPKQTIHFYSKFLIFLNQTNKLTLKLHFTQKQTNPLPRKSILSKANKSLIQNSSFSPNKQTISTQNSTQPKQTTHFDSKLLILPKTSKPFKQTMSSSL